MAVISTTKNVAGRVRSSVARGSGKLISDAKLQDTEYSDEQFHADIEKSDDKLMQLAAQAVKEHNQGKTRKFPI